MQEQNSTLERLQKLFDKTFKGTGIVLTPETEIKPAAGLTSLGYVQFLFALEGEFGIRLKNAELRSFKTVQSIIDAIERAK